MIKYSLFINHYSLIIIHLSLFINHYSLFIEKVFDNIVFGAYRNRFCAGGE